MEFKPVKWLLGVSVAVFITHAALAQDAAKPAEAPIAPAAAAKSADTAGAAAKAPEKPPEAPAKKETASEKQYPPDMPEYRSKPWVKTKPGQNSDQLTIDDNACDFATSEITTIREPRFGKGNVWDIVYAQDGMDVFSDAVPLDNNMIVAAGVYTKDKDDTVYHPLLVKFDERLKPVWEVRPMTMQLQTIHRMIKTKDGFTVLGDINTNHSNGIYIASYDNDGKARGEPASIFEKGGDLDAKSFVRASDGSGYVIAAQFIDSKDREKQNGILYKVSRTGKLVWKRSYKTGRSSVFNNVKVAQDRGYIVMGQIVMEGNISGGWLLRVDENGALKWQRTYPRGQAASFQAAAHTKEGDLILAGKARPVDYDGKGLTAWIMKTDAAGNPLWQRYFKGPYSYEASDLIVYEDGRASVLISGEALDSERRSHARLLTFSPQGEIKVIEDFTEGQNASAYRVVPGMAGERVLVGHAQTSFGEDQESNEASAAPVYTFDGWLMAAVPLGNFDDPCAPAPKISPILP